MRSNGIGEDRNQQMKTGARLRVLIADDHAHLLREITSLLGTEFEVVGAVSDGPALVQSAAALSPDVIVADFKMQKGSGVDAAREILKRKLCDAIVILTAHGEPELVQIARSAGVRGYVLKMDAAEDLIPAVRSAVQGEPFVSRSIKDMLSHS